MNLKGYYIQQATYNVNGSTFSNFSLSSENKTDALCIPPDLFYGVSQDGNVSYNEALYCETPLQGIIPPNIFKYNRSGTVNNTFKDQFIIPNLVKQYQEDGKTVNIYTHFPSKYTTSTKLQEAFNCQTIVPENDSKNINWVFIILTDTIPQKVTSLAKAFYHVRNSNTWYDGQSKSDYNYINYIGTIIDNVVREGFDMDYFDQLKADQMLYSELNTFMHGRLFTSNCNISNVLMLNSGNKIFGNKHTSNSTSQYLQFPQATNNITYFFDFNNTDNKLKSSQIPAASRQWYINAGIIIND